VTPAGAPAGQPGAAPSGDGPAVGGAGLLIAGWPAWLSLFGWLLVGGLALGGGLIGLVGLLWWRGVRRLVGAGRWYGRLEWLSRWSGVRPTEATTPAELADELAHHEPAAAVAAHRLATLYAQERYGRRPLAPAEQELAAGAWRRARIILLGRLLRRGGR
jgi:hypothetical protein